MVSVTDMLGRTMQVPVQPRCIVSLVPSQTELLADLGLEAEVVGITKFCVHPERWFRNKTRVGGTKTVHLERIAELKPDLILANKEENVRDQIEALQSLAPVWVSDIQTLDEALIMIRAVGALCNKRGGGEAIAAMIQQGFSALPNRNSAAMARVAYGIWREPWMWAGGDTFISDLLGRCGWKNVLGELPRYPSLSLEALFDLRPATVLLSSEPYPFKEKHVEEVKAALPDSHVLLVDGEMFSWYGSRLIQAPAYFRALIEKTAV
jgi:ABC-type Fe3+-hydroxamate transport system substrate-binding protein